MQITIIAAVATNGAIGKDNDLIWRLPDDLKFFKQATSGHHIIMGRKNYESIGRPLPKRTNVIITRDTSYQMEGCEVVHSIDEALELAKANGEDEAFIIGGGQIYEQALHLADRMHITFVHESFEADVFFPEVDYSQWKEISREEHPVDERHKFPFSICTFEKNSDID